jgi:hypothetical protein
MDELSVDNTKDKLENVLRGLGFKAICIGGTDVFCCKERFLKLTYIAAFRAYVIESAGSIRDAENNVFEDGDTYPLDLGEEDLVDQLREDVIRFYC